MPLTDPEIDILDLHIRATARSVCGRNWAWGWEMSRQNRDDLLQEGWLAVLLLLPRWDRTRPLWTFVAARVRGAMIDSIRRWSHHYRHAPVETIPLTHLRTWRVTDPDPLATYLFADRSAHVQRALGTINPVDADVITRLYFEEQKAVAVAGVLGKNESRISQRRARALRHLRRNRALRTYAQTPHLS